MTTVGKQPRAAPDGGAILGVDLGGTRLRVAVFDSSGTMVHKTAVPTPWDKPEALVDAMKGALAEYGEAVQGAVVGVPGPVSYAEGRAFHLVNLPEWEERLSEQQLTDEIGLPVLLANDADLAALGEHRFGAGQGVSDMVYLTSSTGVGGGVIVGGRLLHGRLSLAEVGHTVIDWTSGATVEDLGSGTALGQKAGVDGATVTERAKTGDERARAVLREVADAFAIGVHTMVLCFMPQRVVIGGGVSQAGDLLLDPIRERLDRCELCSVSGEDVVVASCGDDVGLLGAFAFWLESAESRTPGVPSDRSAT
jgi:glucokinase